MTSFFWSTIVPKSRAMGTGLSPGYRGLRDSCRIRAASMRFLDGRQPRFTHVPPNVRTSVIAALFPDSAARSAAANAVDPEPRITKSNCSFCITTILFGVFGFEPSLLDCLLDLGLSHLSVVINDVCCAFLDVQF